MFTPFRVAFTLVVFVLAALLLAGHFHNFFFSLMNARISTTARSDSYTVSIRPGGTEIPPPAPPPAITPPAFRKGVVLTQNMKETPEFRPFTANDSGLRHLRLAQENVHPAALVIAEGNYDLAHLYTDSPPGTLIKSENIYTLRLPLLIKKGASLVISGELHLSREKMSFIIASGDFYIMNAKITGWDENKNAPAVFNGGFRPFIMASRDANFFAAESSFKNLGYDAPSSYGMTLSCHRAIIEKNIFSNLYRALYADNAENIFISQNDIHENFSGVTIANSSAKNIISENKISHNRGDGISFLESPENISWRNKIYKNSTGIRIRASKKITLANDEITQNFGPPIFISGESAVNVSRETISAKDGKAAFKIDGVENLTLSGIKIISGVSGFLDEKDIARSDVRVEIKRK